jgi:signal transduction histidine kinase
VNISNRHPIARSVRLVGAYAYATGAVALATVVTWLLRDLMGSSISLFFFPAVVVTAMYGGYGPALVATVLSTASLAFFFVAPFMSFDVGPDDAMRLIAFAVVAIATASMSAARKRAEDAQRKSLDELESAVATLKKVSGWPVLAGATLDEGAGRVLEHAATVVGATVALAVWEAEDEPWLYMASSAQMVAKRAPTELSPLTAAALEQATLLCAGQIGDDSMVIVSERGATTEWRGLPVHPELASMLRAPGFASAPFDVEHLKGRVFFSGIRSVTIEISPLVALVAREIGNSFDQLLLHGRLHQVAIREDRIRVARDLHDGVLQSLTGIRFQLRALADEQDAPSTISDRLLAVERAIAIEQRELRLFIEDLKPAVRDASEGPVAQQLEELRARLASDWSTPIVVRVQPADMALPASTENAVRLMVREAVVNALKHAHPSRVSVDVVAHGDDRLHVVVSNDGRGFPFRGRRDHEELVKGNAGPASLRDRVVSLGGTLAIESGATGSRVEISVPVAVEQAEGSVRRS